MFLEIVPIPIMHILDAPEFVTKTEQLDLIVWVLKILFYRNRSRLSLEILNYIRPIRQPI